MSSDIVITRIVSDIEISTKIYMQYCDIMNAIQIDKENKDKFLLCIIEVMKKLESVKYHRDNLLRILKEEEESCKTESSSENCVHIDLTTGAEKELEVFIMQGKSCLDVLTKIFEPLVGIKIHSYGDSGEKVTKVLTNNLNKEELKKAEPLINMIRDDKDWIEKWFKNDRDTITHYRTVQSSGFIRIPVENGKVAHQLPRTENSIPFHEIVINNYHNLLSFCEDFIPLAASIKFRNGIALSVLPEEKQDSEYPRKFALALIDVNTSIYK